MLQFGLAFDFQYPLLRSNLCNFALTRDALEVNWTFSTLYSGRISATATPKDECDAWEIFQYPLLGSNLCNFDWARPPPHAPKLSVPSTRVESLQLSNRMLSTVAWFTFSTLYSGRISATVREMYDLDGCNDFQYPLLGSNLCNPRTDVPLPAGP